MNPVRSIATGLVVGPAIAFGILAAGSQTAHAASVSSTQAVVQKKDFGNGFGGFGRFSRFGRFGGLGSFGFGNTFGARAYILGGNSYPGGFGGYNACDPCCPPALLSYGC